MIPALMRPLEQVSLGDYAPLPSPPDQYSLEYMERFSAIKLRETDDGIDVGVCNEADLRLIEYLRGYHRKEVRFHLIDRCELAIYLGERLFAAAGATPGGSKPVHESEPLDRLANDAPIVNLVNAIFIEGVRLRASDIHIEAFRDSAVVRYRVDGVLRKGRSFDLGLFPAVASRIKIIANLNIMEHRLPQEGRVTAVLDRRSFDMRLSIVPTANGESIVLRLFGAEEAPRRLDELGLDSSELLAVRRLAILSRGLVLATGPTGSGKSTTLKAMLADIDADHRKIVTIEDPIEFIMPGINQIQTNERIGLGFDMILRRILRQDPDVIMVGEIRDRETAELAVRIALTGHLVLSTLHTHDSVSAVTRLRDLGIPAYLIAAVLRGVVAQRLVRRLCPECRSPQGVIDVSVLDGALRSSPLSFRPAGCRRCGMTGFRGRVAIVEIYRIDEPATELIASGASEGTLRARLLGTGFRPLLSAGIARVARGDTSIEEVEQAVILE